LLPDAVAVISAVLIGAGLTMMDQLIKSGG
jgi:hypothetical protein